MGSNTFEQLLDRLYFSAKNERDKGTKFERLFKRYLQLEPKYSDQFSDVWLWDEWPDRRGQVDTGIDLVAKDRYTGELTAIQCKFYDPQRTLDKKQIDSFFTATGKADFSYGLVVSTTDKWSKHAESALEGQSKPMTRLRLQDLADSTIDWAEFDLDRPEDMRQIDRKEPRKYQRDAIDDVITGFQTSDRGKLIMACGTGKTYTSLKIVEEMVPVGGIALFLVPSIALLQQTLNEWTAQSTVALRPLAVCSDTKVGRREHEDVSVHDLAFPATTDPQKLFYRTSISTGQEAVTVVFSTYQSIDVIAQAQALGLPDFDVILCDEAHRTTGITEAEHDDSAFVRVHDQVYLRAKKRLYMTATPRIYVQDSKAKAAENDVAVYSMDDVAVYGPEFHHLGFGKAVEMGHLADYKVLVLAVNEEAVSRSFQGLFQENGDLSLDDAARIVGCWNGLSKRGVNGERLSIGDSSPMNRAVAFARNIKESKKLAEQFELIGRQLLVEDDDALKLEAEHVDGTFNVLERSAKLDWLQDETKGNVCRILSNAKCLTEGVDVPSLDAVLFLNPRNSQVDVVQAVGRVMRRSEGKEYGYIILPIAVPASEDPETALNDNKKYKVVWDVLQALRAHDDRFEAMINKLDLNGNTNDKIDIITVADPFGPGDGPGERPGSSDVPGTEALFHMASADEWRNAIFARMVRKVGDRRYWEQWAEDVKGIADRHIIRIRTILDGPDARVRDEFAGFLEGLRGNLNASISESDAIDMLSQHLITKPVFEALFEDYSFAAHNPVSQVMDSMVTVLEQYNLDSEVQNLEDFYRSVRVKAEGVKTAEGKQKIITELYEKFFKLAFPRTAESLGIVYTPVEVVDFILRTVDDILKKEFEVSISDEGVHVLDPFTGTGTFIVRLLQSGLIKPEDLLRKYTQELHANELLLMAYYIAAINIEATFHGILSEHAIEEGLDANTVGYESFDGIVLTDTFQMTEDGDTLDEHVFTTNSDRVLKQNALDIRVIIGNPPYSVGQSSGNDNNANLKYPTLDESIRGTYVERSTATNKNSLYDSYIRAIRWASNRVLNSERGGVVCYVSNGGYIDGNTADGLRKTLTSEFHEIYIYNLRGNQRTAGEQSRKEGGKIFDAGSRATVAVLLLVKRPGPVTECRLNYRDIGDYLDRKQKLAIIDEATVNTIPWEQLTPNGEGDWINHRNDLFETFTPLGSKNSNEPGIFVTYSGGLKSNRDVWVYNSSEEKLRHNVESMVDFYNSEVDRYTAGGNAKSVEAFINLDSKKMSWNRADKVQLKRGTKYSADKTGYRVSTYRPFNKQHVQFNRQLNDMVYKLPVLFPTADVDNFGFVITSPSSHYPTFEALMIEGLPDLHTLDTGQFFPRYTYAMPLQGSDLFAELAATSPASGPQRIDNVTDEALAEYRGVYGIEVSKDDIFYYVYGLLHSREYRERFAADLKKMLPRIPKVPGAERFHSFADAGRQLTALHMGYDELDPFPLTERQTGLPLEVDDYAKYTVSKMKYGGKAGSWDKTRIIYNGHVTLEGIPAGAHAYMLGSRSALDWVLERYQVKTDKNSGIVNDPNEWSREHQKPRYIIDLIGKVVNLSLETNRIIAALPEIAL